MRPEFSEPLQRRVCEAIGRRAVEGARPLPPRWAQPARWALPAGWALAAAAGLLACAALLWQRESVLPPQVAAPAPVVAHVDGTGRLAGSGVALLPESAHIGAEQLDRLAGLVASWPAWAGLDHDARVAFSAVVQDSPLPKTRSQPASHAPPLN